MGNNMQRLSATLDKRMKQTANAANRLSTELGIVNANLSITTDVMKVTLPRGDYMVNELLAGEDSLQRIQAGNRVLLCWCGNEPVVLAVLSADTISDNTGGNTGEDPETYMLVFEDGTEVPAVFVEEKTVFTAGEDDIRLGKVAATASGVTTGTKEIPAYHTQEGWVKIPAGTAVRVNMYTDRCRYTKLQALLCAFNGSINESVAAEKVSIDSKVYNVASTEIVAEVTVDTEQQAIDFGMINTNDYPIVVRYFTFTEE